MNQPLDFEAAFKRARQLHAEGRFSEAERAYRQIEASGEHHEIVLQALVELYIQAKRPTEAVHTLVALTELVPDEMYYYARLAALLDGLGETSAAIEHYLRLLRRQPDLADAHFNLALLYKKDKRYADALAAYRKAIELNIANVPEVYCNMGVVYSEMRSADRARAMYERALEMDREYIPALFNLAGLFEEIGDKKRATEIFQRILSINPRHWDSLGRLVYASKVTDTDADLIESLRNAIADASDDRLAQEGLYFALGKALDDLGRYAEAFTAYKSANELGKVRFPTYDQAATEKGFDQLIELFDAAWIERAATDSTESPIFICGMFRSGSTLLEQILAAHPLVTAGGELEILPWLIRSKLAPFPQGVASASHHLLGHLARKYQAKLHELFPNAAHISDKRPDNFLHLGLIKALFPRARIIYTKRNPLDNCLSIFFQQLGGNLAYATDLAYTAHYYRQHERLMAHWAACLGETVFTVEYDELVRSPEAVLRPLLGYMELDWDDRCLDFQRGASQVKTASVWQVREALHSLSSGRWRNYDRFLSKIKELLQPDGQPI